MLQPRKAARKFDCIAVIHPSLDMSNENPVALHLFCGPPRVISFQIPDLAPTRTISGFFPDHRCIPIRVRH